MNKKTIIIIILAVVLACGGFFGYKYYQKYKKENTPNNEDIAFTPVDQTDMSITQAPTRTTVNELAKPKDPQYTNVSTDSKSLYPTLSGVYEAVWDEYESYPIEIVAEGKADVSASFKVIWAKRYLYVQVMVKDATPYTEGEKYSVQDSVEIFVNEDGKKNSTLVVGDAHYIINRDNVRSAGFGASADFESVTYGIDPVTNDQGEIVYSGYVVEAIIPLMTLKATKNASIGFDIQVNDASSESKIVRTEKEVTVVEQGADKSIPGIERKKKVVEESVKGVNVIRWASDYMYTFQNFAAVGTLTFK